MTAVASASVVLFLASGCGFLFHRVEVVQDDSTVNAAFQHVLDARTPARLGDVIAATDLPFESWDRMYTFYSPVDSDEINAALGTDAYWSGLPGGSDSAVQVFVKGDEAVGAYVDKHPRHGVGRNKYATPDSAVTPQEESEKDPFTEAPSSIWFLNIEEAG
ncbi:hypothetical protein ACWCPQ_09545 [Nocardia sp. NPDC001965]